MTPTRSSTQRRRLEELSCVHPNAASLDSGIGFAPRVQVMVGYVELIEGTPATLDESQELRRAFVKELRGGPRTRRCVRPPADVVVGWMAGTRVMALRSR